MSRLQRTGSKWSRPGPITACFYFTLVSNFNSLNTNLTEAQCHTRKMPSPKKTQKPHITVLHVSHKHKPFYVKLMRFYAREQIWVVTHVSGSTAGHALFLIYESIFPISPNRPIGCLSKPRCWIQALTPASGALAGPQPIAPPRPFSCEDVIFLFLSPALPPPSLSLSSFSFLIPLSSPPPLLFSHRYVPLALKGTALDTPLSFPSPSAEPVLSPSFLG